MKAFLQLAAALTLLTLGVGAAVLVSALLTLVRHADQLMTDAQGEWKNEAQEVHRIVASARGATEQAEAFAAEQRAQLKKTSSDSDHQVRALGLVTRNAEQFFYHLDQQVNGKVLPDFDRELISTSTAAQSSFDSLTKSADALTFQLNDPAIGETVRNLAQTSAHTNDILAHADHTAAYYDKKLTTPLGLWRTMLHILVPVAGAAGSVAAGFAK